MSSARPSADPSSPPTPPPHDPPHGLTNPPIVLQTLQSSATALTAAPSVPKMDAITEEDSLSGTTPRRSPIGGSTPKAGFGKLFPTKSSVTSPQKPSNSASLPLSAIFTKATNSTSENWKDLLYWNASVVPKILGPCFVLTIWATLLSVFYNVSSVNFLNGGRLPNSTALVTVLGVVMGLLLVFRTNTSYDRFWEGRRIWSVVQTNTRNLARYTWISIQANKPEDVKSIERLKVGAMNLILAFAIATKNYLRGTSSADDPEIKPLISHLPEYSEGRESQSSDSLSSTVLPLDLTLHLQSFVNFARKSDLIDVPTQGQMTTAISALIDSLTAFERIRSSPIPFAYSIHIKQTLLIYLLSLPFQLLPTLFWATIPATFLSSFTLLGIDAIGGQIENPFGLDPNDLPQDEYISDIRSEIMHMVKEHSQYDAAAWIDPYPTLSTASVDAVAVDLRTAEAPRAGTKQRRIWGR
ncbi:Bestrophin, RFP-TM, chloride channel-domain-containing protein [Zopfochytrium polystomum]|nr:Bestrophin, RFP-TM, chloride channel-domain-containing protein [Zopfochytrium polystomum]